MAKYLVLIYESEAAFESAATRDPADGQHFTFLAEHRNVILAGEGLLPTSTATSLRRGPGGDFAVTDGPFETKEAFGGIYLLEAPDLDVAIGLAKQIPAPAGGVEIRPVMVSD